MTGCRKDCVQLGGDLASIHSPAENEYVTSLIRDRARGGIKQTWIGGRYSKDQAKFYWFDQSDWDFDNWSLREPHMSDDENWSCVFLGRYSANLDKWVDGVCSHHSTIFDCICKM